MPSPSENKAIDLVLAAFPGSEVVTPDRTHRLPLPPAENQGVLGADESVERREDGKKVKQERKKRGKKVPKNMDNLF